MDKHASRKPGAVQSAPEIKRSAVIEAMRQVDGVRDVRHVHIWEIDEHRRSLEATVTVAASELREVMRIKEAVKGLLETDFDIAHSTIEVETGAPSGKGDGAVPRGPYCA